MTVLANIQVPMPSSPMHQPIRSRSFGIICLSDVCVRVRRQDNRVGDFGILGNGKGCIFWNLHREMGFSNLDNFLAFFRLLCGFLAVKC